jgi:hypothetical protein
MLSLICTGLARLSAWVNYPHMPLRAVFLLPVTGSDMLTVASFDRPFGLCGFGR